MTLPISGTPAIDVHAHYGRYRRDEATPLLERCMGGDAATVTARARAANTTHTVVSPLLGLMPRGRADAHAGNEETARVVEQTPGLLQWVVVDPGDPRTYDQARRMLQTPHCVGIKIHPEEHGYPIAEHGREIFKFAADLGAVIQTHSGEPNSQPMDFTPFADELPEVQLILSHLGNSGATGTALDLQVRAIQASRHGNVFTDTSSFRSILPGLIEWAVGEIGAERVLYGTDSPLYFAPSQRARIDHAELTDRQKGLILRENARRLLRID